MLTWKAPNEGLFYWRSLPHTSDTVYTAVVSNRSIPVIRCNCKFLQHSVLTT
ncbi:hypothetical protein H6H03_00915 [Nostoc paludosum FACHB-159]|uniref:Uncharacterized protein n=1 Tax=Nostoc paludosum FACHB-159 TaxID=2692908 RepID=A0ABR8JZV9_9NOSO|nr:hypothetical protein [Nostoc paludosum FACHB-159]